MKIRAVGVGGTSATVRKPDRARSEAVERGKPENYMSELVPEVCRAHRATDCGLCDEHDDDIWVHPRDLEPEEPSEEEGGPELSVTETERWRIHNPETYPRLYYVFTTENDANTALLALGKPWRLDGLTTTHAPERQGSNDG